MALDEVAHLTTSSRAMLFANSAIFVSGVLNGPIF